MYISYMDFTLVYNRNGLPKHFPSTLNKPSYYLAKSFNLSYDDHLINQSTSLRQNYIIKYLYCNTDTRMELSTKLLLQIYITFTDRRRHCGQRIHSLTASCDPKGTRCRQALDSFTAEQARRSQSTRSRGLCCVQHSRQIHCGIRPGL